MTHEEIEQAFDIVDKIAAVTGRPTLRATLEQFSRSVPADVRATVMAQVTEEVAKSVRDGMDKTLAEMSRVTSDQTIIAKLREATPNGEPTDTGASPGSVTEC